MLWRQGLYPATNFSVLTLEIIHPTDERKPELLGIVKRTKTQLINCMLTKSNVGFWEYGALRYAVRCHWRKYPD